MEQLHRVNQPNLQINLATEAVSDFCPLSYMILTFIEGSCVVGRGPQSSTLSRLTTPRSMCERGSRPECFKRSEPLSDTFIRFFDLMLGPSNITNLNYLSIELMKPHYNEC